MKHVSGWKRKAGMAPHNELILHTLCKE